MRAVSNIENEYSINLYLSDTESDVEDTDTPTHGRKGLPTGAKTLLSDAEFHYTPLSNAADDFKGNTRSLPPTSRTILATNLEANIVF